MAQRRQNEPYVRPSCRVSAPIKREAEEAAALLGLSITEFTESALDDKAQAVLDNRSRIELSERDFQRFVQAIEAPSHPTASLREAVAEYESTPKRTPG